MDWRSQKTAMERARERTAARAWRSTRDLRPARPRPLATARRPRCRLVLHSEKRRGIVSPDEHKSSNFDEASRTGAGAHAGSFCDPAAQVLLWWIGKLGGRMRELQEKAAA